jgi:hypothetical protein
MFTTATQPGQGTMDALYSTPAEAVQKRAGGGGRGGQMGERVVGG